MQHIILEAEKALKKTGNRELICAECDKEIGLYRISYEAYA